MQVDGQSRGPGSLLGAHTSPGFFALVTLDRRSCARHCSLPQRACYQVIETGLMSGARGETAGSGEVWGALNQGRDLGGFLEVTSVRLRSENCLELFKESRVVAGRGSQDEEQLVQRPCGVGVQSDWGGHEWRALPRRGWEGHWSYWEMDHRAERVPAAEAPGQGAQPAGGPEYHVRG